MKAPYNSINTDGKKQSEVGEALFAAGYAERSLEKNKEKSRDNNK